MANQTDLILSPCPLVSLSPCPLVQKPSSKYFILRENRYQLGGIITILARQRLTAMAH